MKSNTITEGNAQVEIGDISKISRKMGVFYNPAMKLNRDISILLLNSLQKKEMQIADPLAGTGIRSIRMLLELEKNKIESICINDGSKAAVAAIKKNLKLNKIKNKKVKITNKDANLFMLESTGFDYIDIDPFGYPGIFLDAACQRIARDGILAVTATDTAALAGTSPGACVRKYWAKPLRNVFMHETGARIMIRRVQLSGMQYEKALTPIFTYYDRHYIRAFFACSKGREKASSIFKQQDCISSCRQCLNSSTKPGKCSLCGAETENAGPLWLGKINDSSLAKKMEQKAQGEAKKLCSIISKEAAIPEQWFFNMNNMCRKYKIRNPPQIGNIINLLEQKGHSAARTHFDQSAIRTNANPKQLAEIMAGNQSG